MNDPDPAVPGTTPDGGYLICTSRSDSTGYDLWYAELREEDGTVTLEGTPQVFLRTPYNETSGRLSSDGRYLAYVSDESGRSDVYVRPFPDGGNKWQAPSDGGIYAQWSSKGNELFYLTGPTGTGRGPMMVVPVETTGGFQQGRVRRLFDALEDVDFSDVSADGQQFLAVQDIDEALQPQITITVVENWAREFGGQE